MSHVFSKHEYTTLLRSSKKTRGRIKQHTQNARIDFPLHFNEITPNSRMSPPSLSHLIIGIEMSS
jgi:hypothetical protein